MRGRSTTFVLFIAGLFISTGCGEQKPTLMTSPDHITVSGTVTGEDGRPIGGVAITATMNWADSFTYLSSGDVTAADGRFSVRSFPPAPLDAGSGPGRGELTFACATHQRTVISDVYAIPKAERQLLRVVLPTGREISGRLTTADGAPAGGVMVEANFVSEAERKATVTDAEGRFVLAGLPDEQTTLVAHATALDQKVRKIIGPGRDHTDLELQLAPVVLRLASDPVTLLGMKLVDVNEQIRDAYDLWQEKGVLILDPGADHARFRIGTLEKGDAFWIVGEDEIGGVREFAAKLCSAAVRAGATSNCRVVYAGRRPEFAGTNTQYMVLTDDDLRELRAVSGTAEQ